MKTSFDLTEQRRPGITKLIARIARMHPGMGSAAVLAKAKALYTSPTIVVKRGSNWVEASNPDYLAARDR